MKNNRKRFIFSLIVFLFLFISSCNFFGPPEAWDKREVNYKKIEEEQKEVADQIKAMAFGKNQCTTASDCRVVGLGSVMCGNHSNYLVYSVIGVDESALNKLISQFNENSKKLSDASFKAESCGEPAKKVQCIERLCRVIE